MNSSAHFEQFFLLAAVGAALLLTGCANVAMGRGGRRAGLRAALSAAACGAVVYALGTLTRQELAVRAAQVLGAALLVTVLAGSGWVHRRVAAAAAALRTPAGLWGAVALGGLVVVVGSAVRFELADQQALEDGTLELELALGRQPNQPAQGARAVTDRGTAVVLKEPQAVRDPGVLVSPEERVLRETRLADQVIRHGGPSDESNCHGWVFTGGKFLLSPEDVELILKENGYAEVQEPQPGDVAVYRQGGTVSHTALVRYVAEGQPVLVEGKWGAMGVFLHPADKSPYGTDYTFHRSARRGHLLAGLGGPGTDPGAAPAAAAVE